MVSRAPSTRRHVIDSVFHVPVTLRENPERITGFEVELVMGGGLHNRPRHILRISPHRLKIVAHLILLPTAVKTRYPQLRRRSRHEILVSEATELYMTCLGLPAEHSYKIQNTGHNLMK